MNYFPKYRENKKGQITVQAVNDQDYLFLRKLDPKRPAEIPGKMMLLDIRKAIQSFGYNVNLKTGI